MIQRVVVLVALLLASVAFASTPNTPAYMITVLFANNHDGFLMTECPLDADEFPGAYCYRLETSSSMARLLLHTSVDKYNDLRFVAPWNDEVNGVQSRLLLYSPNNADPTMLGTFILERDRFNVIIMFVPLTPSR